MIAIEAAGEAAIVPGDGETGIEFYGSVAIADRAVKVSHQTPNPAAIHIGFHKARIELNGAVKVREGAFVIVQAIPRDGAIVISASVSRIGADGEVEISQRVHTRLWQTRRRRAQCKRTP
jgi:hypothetical protein